MCDNKWCSIKSSKAFSVGLNSIKISDYFSMYLSQIIIKQYRVFILAPGFPLGCAAFSRVQSKVFLFNHFSGSCWVERNLSYGLQNQQCWHWEHEMNGIEIVSLTNQILSSHQAGIARPWSYVGKWTDLIGLSESLEPHPGILSLKRFKTYAINTTGQTYSG